MPNLAEKVQKFIHRENLIPEGGKVLCAVSGGPDSVAMLHILKELGYECGIAHVNYGLRPEADEEEEFVRRLGEEWGIKVLVYDAAKLIQAKMKHFSLQESARTLRYHFFGGLIRKEGYKVCTTAHHKEDQAETLLMNLLRGKSSQVMKGIPQKWIHFVRPLLETSKDEIWEYIERHQLEYRLDTSNKENKYLRNQVRNLVIPELRKINPRAIDQLIGKAELADAYHRFFLAQYRERVDEFVEFQTGRAVFRIEEAARVLGNDFVGLGLTQLLESKGLRGHEIDQCLKLLDSASGKYINASMAKVIREREAIVVSAYPSLDNPEFEPCLIYESDLLQDSFGFWGVHFAQLERVAGSEINKGPHEHRMDLKSLRFPLTLRRWEQGDRMQPLGMTGTKKLSDIFIDEKWEEYQKNKAFVLVDQEQIICLLGFRIAESVKITAETTEVLKISFK